MSLDVRLSLPAGPLELRLEPGAAALLDRPDADRAVAALTRRTRGWRAHRILLDGRRLHLRSAAARVRLGLGVVGEPAVAPDVPVLDHLAALVGPQRAAAWLEDAPLLAGRGAEPAGVLSGGERRVLAWLRCRATRPRCVVLDRAGTGLDAGALRWAGQVVDRWRDQGVVVLVRPGRVEERAWAGGRHRLHPD